MRAVPSGPGETRLVQNGRGHPLGLVLTAIEASDYGAAQDLTEPASAKPEAILADKPPQ